MEVADPQHVESKERGRKRILYSVVKAKQSWPVAQRVRSLIRHMHKNLRQLQECVRGCERKSKELIERGGLWMPKFVPAQVSTILTAAVKLTFTPKLSAVLSEIH